MIHPSIHGIKISNLIRKIIHKYDEDSNRKEVEVDSILKS